MVGMLVKQTAEYIVCTLEFMEVAIERRDMSNEFKWNAKKDRYQISVASENQSECELELFTGAKIRFRLNDVQFPDEFNLMVSGAMDFDGSGDIEWFK